MEGICVISKFELKKIVIETDKESEEVTATALVEFTMESDKPDVEKFQEALEKWKLQLQGQITLR